MESKEQVAFLADDATLPAIVRCYGLHTGALPHRLHLRIPHRIVILLVNK